MTFTPKPLSPHNKFEFGKSKELLSYTTLFIQSFLSLFLSIFCFLQSFTIYFAYLFILCSCFFFLLIYQFSFFPFPFTYSFILYLSLIHFLFFSFIHSRSLDFFHSLLFIPHSLPSTPLIHSLSTPVFISFILSFCYVCLFFLSLSFSLSAWLLCSQLDHLHFLTQPVGISL